MRVLATLALCGLLSCSPAQGVFAVPPPPAGARTLLLLAIPDTLDPTGVAAIAVDVPRGQLTADTADLPYDVALYFSAPASALGWPLDTVVHHTPTGARLPLATSSHRRRGGTWSESPELLATAAVRKFRFPTNGVDLCAGDDACFLGDPSDHGGLYCGPDCAPLPAIAAPMLPELPRVNGGCPPRFTAMTDARFSPPLAWCDATVIRCAQDIALADGTCGPIGPACGAG